MKKIIIGAVVIAAFSGVLFLCILAASITVAMGSENSISESQDTTFEDFDDSGLIYDGAKFVFPAPSYVRVSSEFGSRIPPHGGIDLAAPGGSPILACAEGVVVEASYHYSWGNHVRISHGSNLYTLYAHASVLLVSKGDKVKAGEQIGKVGNTGNSFGNHLHLEVWKGGYGTKYRVNPRPYIFGS